MASLRDLAPDRYINNQLPGYGELSPEEKERALGVFNTIEVPSGSVNGVASTPEGDKFIMPRMNFETKRMLSEKFGDWWARTTPVDEVLGYLEKRNIMKPGYLESYRGALGKANDVIAEHKASASAPVTEPSQSSTKPLVPVGASVKPRPGFNPKKTTTRASLEDIKPFDVNLIRNPYL